MVSQGDARYAGFLHDGGFPTGRLKRFKLFSFGALALPRYTIWKEKELIELHDNQLSFPISFVADKAAEAFIRGVFLHQRFSIGNRFCQADLEVTAVEAEHPAFFSNTMHYRCISPMVIEHKRQGKKYSDYLAPDHKLFGELLFRNLIAKCAALDLLINRDGGTNEQFDFRPEGSYKSKLITIKPFTREQTKVRGFLFNFTLTAPDYMHEIGYYSGFGMDNAMGFGAVEVV